MLAGHSPGALQSLVQLLLTNGLKPGFTTWACGAIQPQLHLPTTYLHEKPGHLLEPTPLSGYFSEFFIFYLDIFIQVKSLLISIFLLKLFWKLHLFQITSKSNYFREFPAGLVVRIRGFHCRGPGSIPGREPRSHKLCGVAKKKKSNYFTTFILLEDSVFAILP